MQNDTSPTTNLNNAPSSERTIAEAVVRDVLGHMVPNVFDALTAEQQAHWIDGGVAAIAKHVIAKERILTPDVEALVGRYVDATKTILDTVDRGPVSAITLGAAVHLQLETIVTLEHAYHLLDKKLKDRDKTKLDPEIALWSVRHTVYAAIINALTKRTEAMVESFTKKQPSPSKPFCDATCTISAVNGKTATYTGRTLWRVVCPVHGLIHPGTTSSEHWVGAHQERGEVWPGKDDHVPPGTDVPVPAGHPGIVITPMGKKP